MNELTEKAIEMAKAGDKTLNPREIFIPVLDGFEVVEKKHDENQSLLVAVKNSTLEQFIREGHLLPDETLETRISKVRESLRDNIPNKELYENIDDYFVYYEDYKTKDFYYKIFVQDILAGTKDRLLCSKQLNGYFINEETKEFLQISVAAGPYLVNEEHPLIKNIDVLDEDPTIKDLTAALELLMDNITYYYK